MVSFLISRFLCHPTIKLNYNIYNKELLVIVEAFKY